VWPGVARTSSERRPKATRSPSWRKPVRAGGAARLGERDLAAQPLLQERGAGHVVGMDVRLQRPQQLEPELADQGGVAPHLLEHRIDQHRLLRDAVTQEIGVGRRRRIEELAEDEH
jgi:hypothetical protein